jgi:DNA-directed RNA polymerase subunit RPC12/RpoP
MVKCPKCGREVDHLYCWATQPSTWRVRLVDGELDYSFINAEYKFVEAEYYCPNCHALLFEDEEEAKAFLSGEGRADN